MCGWNVAIGFPFCVTQQCLFSGGSRGTVGIVSNVSIYKITLTALTLIYALSIFGNFRSLMSGLFATFSPRLGVIPTAKGIFSNRSGTVTTVQGVPRMTLISRSLRSGTLIRCRKHRTVTIVGKIRSGFRRLAPVSAVLFKEKRLLLRSRIMSCTVPNMRLLTALNANVHFLSPLRICTPGQKTGIGVTGPTTSFAKKGLFSSKLIFTMGRRGCSNSCVLASLGFTQRLFRCAARIDTVGLGVGRNASVSTFGHGLRGRLNRHFHIFSHCRRRTSAFHVVGVRGFVSCLFLAFVLVVTYFGIVNSLSVLVVSGHSSIIALHGLKTGSQRVIHVFLFRKQLVSFVKTISNVILNILLY